MWCVTMAFTNLPYLLVILVLFLSCWNSWLVFGLCPAFPAFFFYALNWLNWLSWQISLVKVWSFIYGLVGVAVSPQLATAAVHEVCSVHCNVCTISSLPQAAPCAFLGHLRTLQLPVGAREGYALPSSHKKLVGLSGLGLMGWWF